MNEEVTQGQENNSRGSKGGRLLFIGLTIGLLFVIVSGLFWLFAKSSGSPIGFGWYIFSFATGLSMIVLPCTLPLAFVIVPLVMGKGYRKGVLTALSFSIGVAITLSMYGILAAVLGKSVVGFAGGTGEVLKGWFYAGAGVFALIFALGELGFLRVRMPSYSGAAPAFIQRRQDIFKPLLMGLFLGNIGVGCPHPATPILLTRIAVEGSIFYGWLLFFVHAIGRILPLLVLAMFGIIGINATKALVRHKDKIARATGWGMVYVGGFLFVLGVFGHAWWVYSGQHSLFEVVTQEERFTGILSERLGVAAPHAHGAADFLGKTGLFRLPLWLGNWVLVFLWVLPLWWYWLRERKRIRSLPAKEDGSEKEILHWKKWFFVAVTFIIGFVFLYVIPYWFLAHKALEGMRGVKTSSVLLAVNPAPPLPGTLTQLTFSLKDTKGNPLEGLKIDHERILHIIIISEDFKDFVHIHPEDFGSVTDDTIKNATFSVPYVFPRPGRYLVALDFLHKAHSQSEKFLVDAGSIEGVFSQERDFSRVKNFGGYTVSLAQDPATLRSGEGATLRYLIEKDGAALGNLESYLGAPMHLAIVGAGLSSFTHTHGEIHDSQTGIGRHMLSPEERFGPNIEAHVIFPSPGLYQIFGEFKHEGSAVQTSFLVNVESGSENAMPVGMPRNNH